MNRNYAEDAERTVKNGRAVKLPGRRTVIALAVLILLSTAGILFTILPQMHIQHIEVTGCSEVPQDALLKSTGLVSGEHLFRNLGGGILQIFTLRYGNMESELREEYPYIDNIVIQAVFPSCVRITVTERQKIGYIKIPDGYAVIDMNGYVVELSSDSPPQNVPLMLGLPVSSASLGEKIDMTDDKRFNTCISVLGAILAADENNGDLSGFSLMSCVRSVRPIKTGTTFLTIRLPSTGEELLVRIGSLKKIMEDMNWLRYAASQNSISGGDGGVLDMTGENYTYRTVT
mgnify:CR=1 FL=1